MKTATFIFIVQSLVCGALAIIFPAWAWLFITLSSLCAFAAGFWFGQWFGQWARQRDIRHFIVMSQMLGTSTSEPRNEHINN